MPKFIFPLVWMVFFIAFQPAAQDNWSLEECIQHAFDHNIQIKQQQLNAQVNENNLFQTRLGALPSLNAGAAHNFSFGRALDETTYEFTQNQEVQSSNFNVNSSMTLFNGFQQWNSVQRDRFSLKASLQDLKRLKNEISLNVASAYLQILFNYELVEVSGDQLELIQQEVERTEKLVEAGSLAKGNLLEMQAQAANEELNQVNARNQLRASYISLIQLLELESAEGFEIERPSLSDLLEQVPLLSVDSIYRIARETLPRIKGAEYYLQSQEEALEVAKGRLSPRLSLSLNYGTRYSSIRDRIVGMDSITVPIGRTQNNVPVFTTQQLPNYSDYPFWDQLQDNASASIMFNLSIPIFNGWQARTSIDNARVGQLQAQYELELQENSLYKDIQTAHADAIAAWKKYQSARKTVESMQESFKYTQKKFEVGLVNSIEFNTAKNNLIRAQSELLQAKYEYLFKTRILDFYQGKPIKI
jgi:outer membrane protein